jgi:hypothetical protein
VVSAPVPATTKGPLAGGPQFVRGDEVQVGQLLEMTVVHPSPRFICKLNLYRRLSEFRVEDLAASPVYAI